MMKRCLITITMVCLAVFCMHAQDQIIKTNPLGLAFGNFNATYEKTINEKSSFLVSANYTYRIFGVDVSTFGFGGAYRFYFSHAKKQVPEGFYINPQANFNFGNADDDNFNTFGIGAEIGYQWIWDSGVVLDLGIGPSYITLSGDIEDIDFDNTSGILPTATLAIGYSF